MIVRTATPFAATLMFLHCAASWSYDADTHRQMATAAVYNSVLTPNCGQAGLSGWFSRANFPALALH